MSESNNTTHQKLANAAAYQQMLINTRLTALQAAIEMAKLKNGVPTSADDLLSDAKKYEDFILKDMAPPADPLAPKIVRVM
jgi:MinD-like ATPase involved in chromosome partitioning or flagellar assembly